MFIVFGLTYGVDCGGCPSKEYHMSELRVIYLTKAETDRQTEVEIQTGFHNPTVGCPEDLSLYLTS